MVLYFFYIIMIYDYYYYYQDKVKENKQQVLFMKISRNPKHQTNLISSVSVTQFLLMITKYVNEIDKRSSIINTNSNTNSNINSNINSKSNSKNTSNNNLVNY